MLCMQVHLSALLCATLKMRKSAHIPPMRKPCCPAGCWQDESSHPLPWLMALSKQEKGRHNRAVFEHGCNSECVCCCQQTSDQRTMRQGGVCLSYLFHFGFLKLLESEFDFVRLHLRLDFLLNRTNRNRCSDEIDEIADVQNIIMTMCHVIGCMWRWTVVFLC